ncbi:G patch domain-containinG protein 8-like, partial [Trifolium medium]|nr:G patch domain-containinG protein 8-like [Trifolium medium]
LSEEDGCLDDWEAVADALYANDNEHSMVSESPIEHEIKSYVDSEATKNPRVDFSKKEL